MEKKPLGYLGGDIMTHGSNLARQYEYDKFIEAEIPVDIYSPVMNKSINDKSSMTEEENNHLAEKIVEADVERLWNSDFTVLSTEQSAIGTMCEMGILYGWKYMAEKLLNIFKDNVFNKEKTYEEVLEDIVREIRKHYQDCKLSVKECWKLYYSDILSFSGFQKIWDGGA